MTKVTPIGTRKADHIRINLEEEVRSSLTTGLERYRFIHRALPELDLEEVNLKSKLFGHSLAAPILISSMTGGTGDAVNVNSNLAAAAQETGIAMGLGSQRAALEHPELEDTFKVRNLAPDILLFANLGAVQLNYGYGLEHCQRAVDMVEADGLYLHFNALQEALQPEGDTRFAGLFDRIKALCKSLPVPVIAKEVGWGFSKADVKLLSDAGIAGIDVAGAGGTSWSQVEMHRAENEGQARLASAFVNWGIPTSSAIKNVRLTAPNLTVFASGGLRSGIDIAKSLALGASLGGMAGPFLEAAVRSVDDTVQMIEEVQREIQVCMFAAGIGSLKQLDSSSLEELGV